LSIPEARDRILARMKEDNASIANMEKRYILIYLELRRSRKILMFIKKN